MKSLDNSWYHYDENNVYQNIDVFDPVTEAMLTLDRPEDTSARVVINTTGDALLMIDGRIVALVDQQIDFNLDSIFAIHGGETSQLTIKLYSDQTFAIVESGIRIEKSKTETTITILQRAGDTNRQVIVTVYILTLLLLIYIKLDHGEIWRGYFNWGRIFSIKDQADTLYKIRPFEAGTVFIVLFFALLGSSLLFTFLFLKSSLHHSLHFIMTLGYWQLLGLWLLCVLVILAGTYSKYLWVKLFIRVFDFRSFSRTHFYNHIKIFLVIFVLFSIVLLYLFVGKGIDSLPTVILIFMTLAVVIKVFLVSLKLTRVGANSIFHLFSYLCATEILPAIIFVKIIILS